MKLHVGRWITWWAGISPDQDAIVAADGAITFADLNRRVNRLAQALAGSGVSAGDRVAVLLTNRPEFLVAMFATSKLGAVLVPLNVRLVASELGYIIGDAGPKVLVSEASFAEPLAELQPSLDTVSEFVSVDEGGVGTPLADFVADASEAEPDHPGTPEEAFAICYTSGTTGRPKGAVLTNANIFWGSLQEIVAFGMHSEDRHLLVVPLCFTGGLITASMPIFHTGATMYLEQGFDPGAALQRIATQRITRTMAVPVMFQAMSMHPDFESADLSSLRLGLVGAAPVPPALVERYHARGVQGFTNAYGLTEGGGFNMLLPSKDVTRKPGAYLPALYNEARVVGEDGAPVEPGSAGELTLRGPTIMSGYWRNEGATAETIKEGWLHTGDLVRVGEDGYFYPIDRVKDMVISGGLNVYPAEVESALFDHPKLQEATVIGLPEAKWGEAVTAVVVPNPDTELSPDEVIDHCRDKLADYKRPRGVIVVDEIPRNASGKVLKRELRERHADHYERASA